VVVYQGKKEMVVVAADNYFITDSYIDHTGRNLCSSVHLYVVLMDNRRKSLETILVLVLALLVLYWLKHKPSFLLAAGILGAIGILIPSLAQLIHIGWMKLGEAMGYVTSKIVLTVIFFLFVVPLSYLSRLSGRKAMKLKSGGSSYFTDRNVTYNKDSMENVW
jgi:hypothetical protein